MEARREARDEGMRGVTETLVCTRVEPRSWRNWCCAREPQRCSPLSSAGCVFLWASFSIA